MNSSFRQMDINLIPNHIRTCMSMLNQAGFQTYLIGGAVRDLLMEKVPCDYDLATKATPDVVLRIFQKYSCHTVGIEHGTVTVMLDGIPVEVTSFRRESGYIDGRRPGQVVFGATLQEDVRRRDFTINALAMDAQGNIYDYVDGLKDINNKIIRMVGEPDCRLSEDYLRLIRAIRFASVLGFSVEEKTRSALYRHKNCLKMISAPRLWGEWIALLCGQYVEHVLTDFLEIIAVIIPNINKMKDFDQCHPTHCYDVWQHTIRVVGKVLPYPELRLAALFHDIGKPSTFTKDHKGVGHFYGHARVSAIIAEVELERLGCPRQMKESVVHLVKGHGVLLSEEERLIKRRLNQWGPRLYFMLINLKKADVLAQSPEVSSRVYQLEKIKNITRQIITQGDCFNISTLEIDGRDLMDLGIPEGPLIGYWLRFILKKVIDDEVKNEREELIRFIKKTC